MSVETPHPDLIEATAPVDGTSGPEGPQGHGAGGRSVDEDSHQLVTSRHQALLPRLGIAVGMLVVAAAIGVLLTNEGPDPAVRSDDFNRRAIGDHWTIVDPADDGTVGLEGAWTNDAWLRLSVPGGRQHRPWDSNDALRVVQPTADRDFTVEVSFATAPGPSQHQGFVITSSDDEWLAFGFVLVDGAVRAQATSTSGGRSALRLDEPIETGAALSLRVERRGNTWRFSTSPDPDEASWSTIGSFDRPLAVKASGPYAGNGGDPAPAFTALVDYVLEERDPLATEDTYNHTRTVKLSTDVEGEGMVVHSPDRAAFAAGRSVTLTAEPAAGWVFDHWRGDLRGTENPVELAMDNNVSAVAVFSQDTSPPVIDGLSITPYQTTAILRWATDEASTSQVEVGTTGDNYDVGTFGNDYPTRDHLVTVPGLTPGRTYHYKVTTTDDADLTATWGDATLDTPGQAGPALAVWEGENRVVGANGQTQTWVNVGGNVSDPNEVRSLTWSLNGGPSRPLTVGPDERRLQQQGDYNAEVPFAELQAGDNEVVLTATDGAGQTTRATVRIRKEGGTASLPYQTDWASAARIGDQAQVVDGRWSVDGSSIHILEPGYDRVVTVGDVGWGDYEVTVPVTVHEIGLGAGGPNSGPALIGLGLHWQGHTNRNGSQPSDYWYPTGALGWYRYYQSGGKFELRGNEDQPIERHDQLELDFDTTYMLKARAEAVDGGVRYSFKAWPRGQAEPATWDLTVVEDAGPATGSVALIAHHVDAQIGDVTVTSVAD